MVPTVTLRGSDAIRAGPTIACGLAAALGGEIPPLEQRNRGPGEHDDGREEEHRTPPVQAVAELVAAAYQSHGVSDPTGSSPSTRFASP